MDARTRRVLSMAEKVLRFEREFPSEDPGQQATVTRLELLLSQVNDLITQENLGLASEGAARQRRRRTRAALHKRLRHLVNVAEVVTRELPDLEGEFVMPQYGAPGRAFMGQARTLLAQAAAHREAFLAAGIGVQYFERAEAAVAAYDAASTAADTGREAHVQARAVFTTLRSDVLEVVRVLDGLNAARFAESPGQRAKWESARNVFGPVTRGGEVTDPTLLGSEDGSRKTA